MNTLEKLSILADSAKYDVSCASSGVARKGKKDMLGSCTSSGICHSFSSDGRCISLLKVLFSNACTYDCKFCINRKGNDIQRATFTPKEVCELTYNFYLRNYIEGLFLSSAIIKNPTYTMELIYTTVKMLRQEYQFNGYIHIKAIPGADEALIEKCGLIVDRMSVNIELPTEKSLLLLAPDKSKADVFTPMDIMNKKIIEYKDTKKSIMKTPSFIPGGQSTQMIVGATNDSDLTMLSLTEGLYNKYNLKRVYFSAYTPVNSDPLLPAINTQPQKLREHRLYQADFLLRFYDFKANEILNEDTPFFNRYIDPKCQWALNHLNDFPVEINKAPYHMLLRVPGIGVTSAKRITLARRHSILYIEDLKKIGAVVKRAKYFITCNGKYNKDALFNHDYIENSLVKDSKYYTNQISLFSSPQLLLGGQHANLHV